MTVPTLDPTGAPTAPPVADAPASPRAARARRSPWRTALRRFARHRVAVVSAVFLLLVVFAAIFARALSGHDPNAIDLFATRAAPGGDHLLGTDTTGRDVLSRLLYAGRVSLGVGLASAAIAVVIGTVLGSIAGLLGGWVDAVVMRLADVFMSFPSLVVMVVLAGILGPSVITMVIAIGLFQWPACGRLVRGVTLSLREQEFVLAARSTGAGPLWLVSRHIIPATLPPVSVVATLAVAQAIALEATMSFLGLGVQPPAASWGNMLTDAQSLTVIRYRAVAVAAAGHRGRAHRARRQLHRRRPARRRGSEAVMTPTQRNAVDATALDTTAADTTAVDRGEPLLRIDGLTVDFHIDGGVVHAVSDVSLSVWAGEIVAVVGESGSGKSVTAMSVLRLLREPPARTLAGTITFRGRDLRALTASQLRAIRGGPVGMIFQDPMTDPEPGAHRRARRSPRRYCCTSSAGTSGRPGPGRWSCWRWSGYPTRRSGRSSTRTSSPAGCGSGR